MATANNIPWNTVQLSNEDVFEFESGVWTGKKPPFIECAVLRNTNFAEDGTLDYTDVAKIAIEERLLGRKRLVPGDIIVERSGGGPTQPVGRVAYFDKQNEEFCFSNFTSRLRVRKPELVAPRFLHLFLLSLHVSGQTEALQRRTTGIRNLDFNEYLKLSVPLPPVPEQRAIAHLLETLQKAREARQRELTLERERKAALMEQLFTHGSLGEQVKNSIIGEIPQSWAVKQLAELADIYSGGTPSKERAEWWSGSIPWASPKDLKQPRLTDVTDHVTEEAVHEGSRLAPAKSIFIAVRGMILAKDVPISLTEVPMAFNQDIKAVVARNGIDPDFLLFALYARKRALVPHIGTSAHGTRRIGGEAIATMEIPVPNTEEQQFIAQVLECCAKRIALLEREVELMMEFFDALLEELMTGRLPADALIESGANR
jgi:type I restriction enzyme S subunit